MRYTFAYGHKDQSGSGGWSLLGFSRIYRVKSSAEKVRDELIAEGYDCDPIQETADLCRACRGKGYSYVSHSMGLMARSEKVPCGACGGSGYAS